MIDTLRAAHRRLAALALVGIVLAVVWLAVIYPLIAHVSANNEERRSQIRALVRDRALVSQAPPIQKALALLDHSPRWARLFGAQKPEQASLQLQTDVRSLLKSPNALTSMTVQPATSRGPLTRIAVKVTVSMRIDQWAEALADLQLHPRLLQIDSVTIQAPDFQTSDANPTLTIQAEIAGFMLTPKAARS